jgi:hypothetical protein
MLNQYKNSDQIQDSRLAISADRYPITTKNLFKSAGYSYVPEITTNADGSRVEFHLYSSDAWLTGNHWTDLEPTTPVYFDSTGLQYTFNSSPVVIDIARQLQDLDIQTGNYTIIVNFFKNLIGSYEEQYLKIEEISPDRTELKLRLIDSENQTALQQIVSFAENVNQTLPGRPTGPDYFNKTYLLNFSQNKTAIFVNSVVVGEYLYVKLLDPLDDTYEPNFKCWVVEERKSPYTDHISIVPQELEKQYNILSGPNWDAVGDEMISTETGFKTWSDLIGSSVQTSQQIIDSYFSGSLSGIKLNIDYTDFNNFIFYSSATERVKNFKYKLELLEFYNSQSVAISQLSGSVATTNATDIDSLRTNVISGFDNFEKILYYESSSVLYTNEYPHESPIVSELTGSYITPVPKTNSTRPYTLTSTTSSQFDTWYDSLLSNAETYDSFNLNMLNKTIPMHIRYNSENQNMRLFTDMLGHHYDIIWTYINNIHRLYKHEENPKLGVPNELLYSVAKQFGWNLVDGKQDKQLWEYLFGTDESGTPITGSNSVTGDSLSARDITYSSWRRIVNNLPGLLKTKGTARSIKALLSCYGIPESIITIKEYGGPRINRIPEYKKLNFDYSLDLINNTAGTVTVNYTEPIQSVELRFRTDDVVANPAVPNTMHLYTIDGNDVTIDFVSGTYGTISINGNASNAIEMFDGGWINTVLKQNGSDLELIAKRSKYGKIVAAASASDTGISFGSTGTMTLGGTSGGAVRLQGQLQELRLWSSSLNTDPFENHTKAPGAYDGNLDAYDELVFRVPLNQKIDHTATSSLQGVEPRQTGISASFASWTNAEPYNSLEETYYYDSISIAAGTYDDNKIRLEDNELIGTLDVKTRAERSQYDKAPLDSKKLGVYFSPQTMIDEDIIAQLGETYLDEYIGDPGDTEDRSYPRLVQYAQRYWKKYSQNNDMNAYIKIFTLFDMSFFKQLLQLLPARTDKLTGLLIQPNILERSKDTALPTIVPESFTYNTTIDLDQDDVLFADVNNYEATVNAQTTTLNSDVSVQYTADITGTNADLAYNGVPYSYDSVYLSGSTFVQSASPYWYSDAVLPSVTTAVPSAIYSTSNPSSGGVYGSGTYGGSKYGGSSATLSPAQIQDYLPQGLFNLYYNGSTMSSPGFNIDSQDTVDGGPVVEIIDANPNQIVFQSTNNSSGNFSVN